MSNKKPSRQEVRAKLNNGQVKPMSNEEIKRKRKEINKKILLIHELIQEGRFSEAEKIAKYIAKTEKFSNR